MTKIETFEQKKVRLARMEVAMRKLDAEIKAATNPIEAAEWRKIRAGLVKSIDELKADLAKPFLPVEGTKIVQLKK